MYPAWGILSGPLPGIINGIQTKGILLDEDRVRFLAAKGFGPG